MVHKQLHTFHLYNGPFRNHNNISQRIGFRIHSILRWHCIQEYLVENYSLLLGYSCWWQDHVQIHSSKNSQFRILPDKSHSCNALQILDHDKSNVYKYLFIWYELYHITFIFITTIAFGAFVRAKISSRGAKLQPIRAFKRLSLSIYQTQQQLRIQSSSCGVKDLWTTAILYLRKKRLVGTLIPG